MGVWLESISTFLATLKASAMACSCPGDIEEVDLVEGTKLRFRLLKDQKLKLGLIFVLHGAQTQGWETLKYCFREHAQNLLIMLFQSKMVIEMIFKFQDKTCSK